jgi:preprotein translocase SecE subunit
MTRLGNYIRDTIAEMKHVSWPTQSQAIIYTVLVVVISVVVAIMLSSFDYVFTQLLDQVV